MHEKDSSLVCRNKIFRDSLLKFKVFPNLHTYELTKRLIPWSLNLPPGSCSIVLFVFFLGNLPSERTHVKKEKKNKKGRTHVKMVKCALRDPVWGCLPVCLLCRQGYLQCLLLSSKVSWFGDKQYGHSNCPPPPRTFNYTGRVKVNSPSGSLASNQQQGHPVPLRAPSQVPICQRLQVNNDCRQTVWFILSTTTYPHAEQHIVSENARPPSPPSLTLPAKRTSWFDDARQQVLKTAGFFYSTFISSFHLPGFYFLFPT